MIHSNYTRTLLVPRKPQEAYEAISNIAAWWTINAEGSAAGVGDSFLIRFGDPVKGRLVHRTVQQVAESVPGQRIAWTVTECHMPWLKDQEEWKGTTMVFDLSARGEGTRIDFTHIGLTPQVECFEQCERGWVYVLEESLQQLIVTGTGRPDTSDRNHMDSIGHVHPANS